MSGNKQTNTWLIPDEKKQNKQNKTKNKQKKKQKQIKSPPLSNAQKGAYTDLHRI